MSGRVIWQGESHAVRVLSVRGYIEWLSQIAQPLVSADPDAIDAHVDACLDWLVEQTVGLTKARAIALISMEVEAGRGVLDACFDVLNAQHPPRWDSIKKSLRVSASVPMEYAGKKRGGCECARCSGISESPADCKYLAENVSVIDRMIANLDIAFATKMMDEPWWIYDLHREQQHVSALKMQWDDEQKDASPQSQADRNSRHKAISRRMIRRYHKRAK